jgi:hypothetical protein
MRYRVRARLREGVAAELHRCLADGTIAAQRPDGGEILASMARARVTPSGVVEWSETCYCSPPLAHERATVYDRFFEGLEARRAEGDVDVAGEPFLEHLAVAASRAGEPS